MAKHEGNIERGACMALSIRSSERWDYRSGRQGQQWCWWRVLLATALHLQLALAVTGCSAREGNLELRWTEEVALSNGETINVTRHEVFRRWSDAGGATSVTVPSATISVASQHLAAQVPPVEVADIPIIYDIDPTTQRWYVVTVVQTCPRAQKLGVAGRPYLIYELIDGVWQRHTIDERLIGKPANLLLYKESVQPGVTVTLDEKRIKNSHVGLAHSLKQVRARGTC